MNKKMLILAVLMGLLMVLSSAVVSAVMTKMWETGARMKAYPGYPNDDPSIIELSEKTRAQGRTFYMCNPTGWTRSDGTPGPHYPVDCVNNPGYPAGYEAYATYVETDAGEFFPAGSINWYVGAQNDTYWCDPTIDESGARWLLFAVDREPTDWEGWDYALKVSSIEDGAEIYVKNDTGWPPPSSSRVFAQTGNHAKFYYGDPLYCVGSGSALVDDDSWTEAPHLRCAHSNATSISFWEPQDSRFYTLLRSPIEEYIDTSANILTGDAIIKMDAVTMPNGAKANTAALSLSGTSNQPAAFTNGGTTSKTWRAIPLSPNDAAGYGDMSVKQKNALGEHVVILKMNDALMHFLPNMFDQNTLNSLVGKSITVQNYGQLALGVFGNDFPIHNDLESGTSLNILFQAPAWIDTMQIRNIHRGAVRGLYDEAFYGDVIIKATVAPGWKGVEPMYLTDYALGVTFMTTNNDVDKDYWSVPNTLVAKMMPGATMSNVVKEGSQVSADISATGVKLIRRPNPNYKSYYVGPVLLLNNDLAAKEINITWTSIDEINGDYEGTMTVRYDARNDLDGVMRGMQTDWWTPAIYSVELTVIEYSSGIVPLENTFVLTPDTGWVNMYRQLPSSNDEYITYSIAASAKPNSVPGDWRPPCDGGYIAPTEQQLKDAVAWAYCLCRTVKPT